MTHRTHRTHRPTRWPLEALIGACLLGGCPAASSSSPAPPPSASVAPPYVPTPREGCLRSGPIEGVETDPACVVARADDNVTRDAMKTLTIELTPDASVVVGGTTVLLRLAITNRGSSEAEIVLVAQPPGAAARPDWTRLAGVPEVRPSSSASPAEGYRLAMPVRTLDAHERSIDGLPTTTPLATGGRLLRVRLRPGGKLTHTFAWWALRIPAPSPIFRDDAGHRIVPKTAPQPLPAGEYVVSVDLPLFGVSPAEATASAQVRVEKGEALPAHEH
jgi:hypothetical protein